MTLIVEQNNCNSQKQHLRWLGFQSSYDETRVLRSSLEAPAYPDTSVTQSASSATRSRF